MKDSWLTPEGKIIEVGDFRHNEYAYEYLKTSMTDEEYKAFQNRHISPYIVLHEKGWIRVKFKNSPKVEFLGDCIDLTKPQRNTIDPAMNDRQLKVAKMICDEVGEDFHRAINDKRFW